MPCTRTDHRNTDFLSLVKALDKELAERDGIENQFYAQFNGVEALQNAVVLYIDERPVACGAFKPRDVYTALIKRMYCLPSERGRGYAAQILLALEDWAKELGYTRTVLETGSRQREALRLYKKHGYQSIPNYPPYTDVTNSHCFEKQLL